MKNKCLVLSLIMLMILCVGCSSVSAGLSSVQNGDVATPANDSETLSQKINIVKSELKLTQEDALGLMRQELLRKNEQPADDEEIIVMVTLNDNALIDTYNNGWPSDIGTLAQYAASEEGLNEASVLYRKQSDVIDRLQANGLINAVEHRYGVILNAVAVSTTYGKLDEIESMYGVSSVIISNTYSRPQNADGEQTSAIENFVDVYKTGIFNSGSVSYTGEGTAVAILDSGFDCSHSVFNGQPSKLVLTEQDVSAVLDKTKALGTTKGLELSDVYYSRKIPFVYDYADKDPDVFPYDSEHGTHVAGIIGGKDDTITGVAINTQLVLMKVFPDLDDGAETDDILAALEDAVLLGVDAINMSLGSSCGFTREEDGNAINTVYDKINESGISLLTAASNSYSSGYGGAQGNTNLVTNPDSATVGSPSTYAAALSVASISGTKSRYLFGNNEQIIFFNESNAITGDQNDFFKELGITEGQSKTYEYVTIPGVGLKVNYSTLGDITGKIALIKRGDNTFEEKAFLAKNAGAVACIIYNNIDGDILMSMGKTDHIPTISISKDDGTMLASRDSGTIVINYNYQAGPFMSDFSSWGPSPSLELKPDITAHGGNIKSSVPGGGYDELSGTSMATPNLCGIVVLIRQYLKDTFPDKTAKQVSVLANQLLMSTATIVFNEEGNPYSPRKQGAGLASLSNAVNTKAYISVDGGDRTKLELKDDPARKGIYEMNFNIVNLSDSALSYSLSLLGMTESVSTSDSTHVAEKAQMLNSNFTAEVEGQAVAGAVNVAPNATVKVKLTYTLTAEEKTLIETLFPYGMYVEGFVKLAAADEEIDLNIPFLAFYGDWTEAPMFDKTYYEVETEAHNKAIDDEDKIKADYFATTPYGSYYYNYIIPLGTYLYDIDETAYDAIPATTEHIALSDTLGTIDGISAVYAGLLRNAKTMKFSIVDKLTGEVKYENTDYNATKAFSYGGSPVPYYDYLKISSFKTGLINNRQYEFKMEGVLDYGDGGISKNIRNSFSFDFYLDNEAPVIKDTSYEKIYDKTLKKDRYYLTMTIYDNQYVQSITPIIFTSNSSYSLLTKNPIPVYSEKGTDNVVRFEITDYLEDIYADTLITNALAFSIDDYALNSNIYLCQLPGTQGDFKFTRDGSMDGTDLSILTVYEGDIVDLTKYLATSDDSVDSEKDYLKYLVWTSSDDKIAIAKDGLLQCISVGRASVSAKEKLNNKQAILIVNVKAKPADSTIKKSDVVDTTADSSIKNIRFSYFNTLFAYSRSAQTSEIGDTGDRKFINSMSSISFYPGEKIQLYYDLDPWYATDKYKPVYSSTNEAIATVDQDGVVLGLKKGTTTIVLTVEGSNQMARVKITVKSEFVIEDRTLIAYKGLGGDVVIPDDEGILYIGAYSFCLYETDHTIELTEEDYDANKIPSANTTITSIVIPNGVEDIYKYAFYNCSGLRKVTLPSSVKFIRECAFYNNIDLTEVNCNYYDEAGKFIRNGALEKVQTIGRAAFEGCKKLTTISLSKVYAIGKNAFEGCEALQTADLTALRNAGETAFKNCKALTSVILTKDTKLSYAMFVLSGLTSVDIYQNAVIPTFCFAKCDSLVSVVIHNDSLGIGFGAFSECKKLTDFRISGKMDIIEEQAFYGSTALAEFTLPNCEVILGNYTFFKCAALEKVVFQKDTKLTEIQGSVFQETALSTFQVATDNQFYSANNGLLLSADGKTIIFAAIAREYGDFVIDSTYTSIAEGSFCGANITSLTVTGDLSIGAYAFANCKTLVKITFPENATVTIGKHAFNYAEALTEVNLGKIIEVGEYAFANSSVKNVITAAHAAYGEGVFFQSKIEEITVGEGTRFGLGCFQKCLGLKKVLMPENGNVHFGNACFANDTALSEIDLSKTDSEIEKETFYGCTRLKVANLLNVETIGDYAFGDCASLNHVEIPKVKKLGEGAFARYETYGGAPVITEITLPDTLTEMGDGVFLGCEGLLEVTIPSSVIEWGDYMFAYCKHLEKVVLPESIKRIGKYSFAGCEVLTTINLEHVSEFADYALASDYSLNTVNLSSAKQIGFGAFASSALTGDISANLLEEIGDYAFQDTDILSFSAPCLKKLGDAALQNNKKLKEFVVPACIEKIGVMAFNGCTSLESFYYIDENGEKCADGKINDYAFLQTGALYNVMESGYTQLSSVPAAMKGELEVAEGTYRIETYAGNANTYLSKVILPDSLKSIGNYAFYGYSNLKKVEFRSFTAPALENSYDDKSEITTDDPGFELLHNTYDIFELELCYYNFVDLVGKKQPIGMILPSNENIEGYDSLIYLTYFGPVEDARRSVYVAMDKNLVNFYKYANEVAALKIVVLTDEALVNNALSALNACTQNPVDFGYSSEEWQGLITKVTEAKAAISAIKLANANVNVRNIQARIDLLGEVFEITALGELQALAADISALKPEDKVILNLSKYNKIFALYNVYREEITGETAFLRNAAGGR